MNLWSTDLADKYVVQCGGIHFFKYQTFYSCSYQQSQTIAVIIVVIRGQTMTYIIQMNIHFHSAHTSNIL